MGGDKARISYDVNQQYRSVVAQQGRVTLEADWNEAQQILNEELREEALDFVGPSGTPDDGYKIELSEDSKNPSNFTVGAGTMYVGGVRVFLSNKIKDINNQQDWLDHAGDPNWIEPSKLENSKISQLVYLYLREQEISAVEDSALREVALGGPDTTQRTRLIQHIVRLPIEGTTCKAALDEAIGYWQKHGLNFNPQTMRLESFAKLQVSFSNQPPAVDSCNPETKGGYLGAENQLIRVQISKVDTAKGEFKLLWGFDNASFLYRVDVKNNQTLKLQSSPVDDFHRPREQQAVEVLRSAAQLSNDEYIASATGVVYTLAASDQQNAKIYPYNPDTQEITLPSTLPGEYQNSEQTPRVFLRVWEKEEFFTPGKSVILGNTGLQVTLQIFSESSTSSQPPFKVGDYWLFAVRPTTPEQIYPKRYLEFQPPDGPRLWVCPLGVISGDGRSRYEVEDCRQHFDDLVKLTKRQVGGCCTIVVKPEDLKGNTTLQSIVEQFAKGDRVTICLMPGVYKLPRSLVLETQHSNLTIEGCNDGAELQAEPGREGRFLHGLIVLNRADNVTFRNLKFKLPIVPFLEAGGKLRLSDGFDEKFQTQLSVSIGIYALHSALLTVQNCLFHFAVEKTVNLFAAGIFAGSECLGLKLLENRFLRDDKNLLIEVDKERFLVGYLLAPSLIYKKGADNKPIILEDPTQFSIVPSLLQDATIRDNHFTGLTTAILIFADTGLVRLENNTVFQCISGFWLESLIAEKFRSVFNHKSVFLLSILFPLAPFFNMHELVQTYTFSSDIPDRSPLSFHILSNDIEVGIVEESVTISGPGLVISANSSETSSVLLTANKIRKGQDLNSDPNKEDEEKHAVFIEYVKYCIITGNLIILNQNNEQVKSLKLHNMERNPLAITGNVFQGQPEPLLDDQWKPLNTVITVF